MKRDANKPGDGSFADRMRERLDRGTDAAKKMIDRVRELVESEQSHQALAHADVPKKAPSETTREKLTHTHAREKVRAESSTKRATATEKPTISPDVETDAEDEGIVEITPEFATATMGAILFKQGRTAEALAVYATLLERNPLHNEAVEGAERCRIALRGTDEGPLAVDVKEPNEMLDRADPPANYNVSVARALPVDPSSVVAFWELTEDSLARAGTQTGWGATLSLRVVSIREVAGSHGDRVERFIDDVGQRGNFFVRNLPTGSVHYVSVGLRKGPEFVVIASSAPIRTPRGRPVATIARVKATVAIPPRTEGPPSERPRIVDVEGPIEQARHLAESSRSSMLFEVIATHSVSQSPETNVSEPESATPFEPREEYGSMPTSTDLASRRARLAPDELADWDERDSRSSGQWTSSWQSGIGRH